MIQRTDLSGVWGFRSDPGRKGIEQKFYLEDMTDTVLLPGTVAGSGKKTEKEEQTAHLDPVSSFEGYAWFSRRIEIGPGEETDRFFLKLERTRKSLVWLNGEFLSQEESFCTPHFHELTGHVRSGTNRITILVSNVEYRTKGGHMTSPDTQTNWNGILGEIALLQYRGVRIGDFQVYPDAAGRRVEIGFSVEATLTGTQGADAKGALTFSLCPKAADAGGELLCEKREISLRVGQNRYRMRFSIPDDRPLAVWDEFDPFLYRAVLRIEAAGGEDLRETTVGFRDLKRDERFFYLNDRMILLRGKHDGMVFPLTGYAPMEKEAWRKVFETAKQYGINHYRFHTCCPPEAAFCAADEMGIYLEPELPFWGTVAAKGEDGYDPDEREFLFREGKRILKAFGNHPSFLLFSLGNELWGSHEALDEILGAYKGMDSRHWYTQGSNNFQFAPVILPNDDFFCGVRFAKDRLFRGSYAMCDAPQGIVQTTEPESASSYDQAIRPPKERLSQEAEGEETRQIQYGTGVRTVYAQKEEPVYPKVPVVSHEIGQYAMCPDLTEAAAYTGALRAGYLEVYRRRLSQKGLLEMADRFFKASGKLAVSCYKRELETAFRSRELAGFQILDLQDFPGQGIALVGVLNAFMESKGLIRPEEWRQFCGDRVLMLSFDRYVYSAGDRFSYRILFANMNPAPLEEAVVEVSLRAQDGELLSLQKHPAGALAMDRLLCLGEGQLRLPDGKRPQILTVQVSLVGTQIRNSYELYVYPRVEDCDPGGLVVTDDGAAMRQALALGKRVLFFGGSIRQDRRICGTYCTDFWCYPMFRSISDSMGKPRPIGTMGLYVENSHPALSLFPAAEYATPQWYKIVDKAPLAVLDDLPVSPIVWMIDNFERCHRIGLLYEAAVGSGRLLVCQADLSERECPEKTWLYNSLVAYAGSEKFCPTERLTLEQLGTLYG